MPPKKSRSRTYQTRLVPSSGISKNVVNRNALERQNKSGENLSLTGEKLVAFADAVRFVEDMIDKKERLDLELVTFLDFRKNFGKLRSQKYEEVLFICLANTFKCVGWVVCKRVFQKHCLPIDAVRDLDSLKGTTSVSNHLKWHDRQDGRNVTVTAVSAAAKSKITAAAIPVVVKSLFPFSFARSSGMVEFAEALIDIGRCLSSTDKIDVSTLLPAGVAVRQAMQKKAAEDRETVSNSSLASFLKQGGGISCDGLKESTTGKKFYDLVLNYVEISEPHPVTMKQTGKFVSKVLLLAEHTGAESAREIRQTLTTSLNNQFNLSFENLFQNATLVTDWAPTLPCINDASASSSKVPLNESWLGCICHKLNTLMRHAMEQEEKENRRTHRDLESVKKLVRIFKKGAWNLELPDGYSLYQETETRFGSIFDVAKCFIKSQNEVLKIVNTKTHAEAKALLSSLNCVKNNDGTFASLPAIKAIVSVFQSVRHMQTALEGRSTALIHTVLPMFVKMRSQIRSLAAGVSAATTQHSQSGYDRNLAANFLIQLNTIEIHDIWTAACVLHPCLKSLTKILPDVDEREKLRSSALLFIRRLMDHYQPQAEKDTEDVVVTTSMEKPNQPLLGSDSFQISEFMSVESDRNDETDELSRYLSAPSISSEEVSQLAKDPNAILQYWIDNKGVFPILFRVAMRIYGIPPSSVSSESNFSVVNHVMNKKRNRVSTSAVNDLVFLRSHSDSPVEIADIGASHFSDDDSSAE